MEKRKWEREKLLPINSTWIKQESPNRVHPLSTPSLTPHSRPRLPPSSLPLASDRTPPLGSVLKTPLSLPNLSSEMRSPLKLSPCRGKKVESRELHKPQVQTPHREKNERGRGEGGWERDTTPVSSPGKMDRRRLPGMTPAWNQELHKTQPQTPHREEKERRRRIGSRQKDTTPVSSPRKIKQLKLPDMSPAKSPVTPTRPRRLESYLLLDPDATPPLRPVTPTQLQQKPPTCSTTQHYPSTDTQLLTSPVSPPPEVRMTSPPPPLPATSASVGEDHLQHSVAIPRWTTDELKEKSKPLSLPSIDPLLPGLYAVSLQADSGFPFTKFSWNALETRAQAMQGRDGKRSECYVHMLEELTSRGSFIPHHHLESVLRTLLTLTDTNLLLRVHTVLASDASLRPSAGLSVALLWDLMEVCCKKLSQGLATTPGGSTGEPYPLSAHVVLLYLVALLVKDLASSEAKLGSSLVERMLSLTSKWQHVLVVLDLLFKLLPNNPAPSSLPDLCSVLSLLICLPVVTSQECDQDSGISRLARELSRRVAHLPSVQLKTHLLLLLPCHLLREKVISIHLNTEFLLLQDSSQDGCLPSDHVSFELITNTHLRRSPYHCDGTPHDLSLFLFLQCHLLQSHCAQLLGHTFLHSDHTPQTTLSPSAPLSPARLANQLQSITSHIRALPSRLSEDPLLTDLTSPLCWFHLEILGRMTSCGQY